MEVVQPCEWFGFDALLPSRVRAFSAVSRATSVVCFVERNAFVEVVRRDQRLAWKLTSVLNVALHNAQRANAAFVGKRVRRSIADALEEFRGRSIELKQVEIAALLGISPETVSRELKRRIDAATKKEGQ